MLVYMYAEWNSRSDGGIVEDKLLDGSGDIDHITQLLNKLIGLRGWGRMVNGEKITVIKSHPYQSVIIDDESLEELVVSECAQHWEEVSVNTHQLTHSVTILD